MSISEPGDRFEQEAQTQADALVHGQGGTATITASRATPTIQRAGMQVKQSIPQPTVDRSSDVPDLTTSQVNQINMATSDSDRLAVVKALVEDLVVNKGLLNTSDVPGDRKVITDPDPFVPGDVCIIASKL